VKFEEIRDLLQPILERKGARLAVLFGSHARGTADERSDVDLIIVDDQPLRYLDRIGKYFDDIRSALRRHVDLLVCTDEEVHRLRDGRFVARALEEGRVIYERRETAA
jgi:predicted nucleotidyltransferase